MRRIHFEPLKNEELRCTRVSLNIATFVIGYSLNTTLIQSKQVKRSSHEWINKFIIANLISVIIISIIC